MKRTEKMSLLVIFILLVTMLVGCYTSVQMSTKTKGTEYESENMDTEQENVEADNLFEGKWKVTGIVAISQMSRTDYYSYHYLGRTVIIEDNSIETSIWYWPFELGWRTQEYDYAEIDYINYEDSWLQHNQDWVTVYDIWGEEYMPFIRFYSKDEGGYVNHAVILDEGHLAYDFPPGYYLLEPFSYGNPDLDRSSIMGEWQVAFLDSYDNSYEGGWREIEEVRSTYQERIDELNGSDFYAEDWLRKKIVIGSVELEIDNKTYSIRNIYEEKVSKKEFEEEWEIHDELSLYNDTLNVVFIECENNYVFPVVLVDEQRVIIHIEQGWFMLNKIEG